MYIELLIEIIYWLICDEMVDIVVVFLLVNGQVIVEVGDEEVDQGIDLENMGDGMMVGIMGSEYNLLLQYYIVSFDLYLDMERLGMYLKDIKVNV